MSSSVRAIRRMSLAKLSVLGFVAVALVTTLLLLTVGQGFAMPGSPTDESKVPHYFGPYPNWANSPLTLPAVTVDVGGDGTGAKATATVGANGAITGVTITNPGSGYATATFTFNSTAGSGASATPVITTSGAVAAPVSVDAGGSGYLHPVVAFSGGTTDATGTVFGGVDNLAIDTTGITAKYHIPTVAFDLPDDPNGTVPSAHVTCVETGCIGTPNPVDGSPGEVTITGIVLDTPGSGYTNAPGVAILDGTQFDPIRPGGSGAVVTSSLFVQSVSLDTFGGGYVADPVVLITDKSGGPGTGALASAKAAIGEVTGFTNLVGGAGYVTAGGIKKFQDPLPGLCDPDTVRALAPACKNDGSKEIPLAVADPDWTDGTKTFPGNDTYEIALVQYQMKFSSDLPPTLVRGYVQIQTPGLLARGVGGAGFPLTNTVKDPNVPGQYIQVPALINGVQAVGVTNPQYLGPTIVAVKDTATRIVFHNLLPTQSDGDLFLPVDSTIMGSGMGPNSTAAAPTNDGTVMDGVRNPMCTEGFMPGMPNDCFTQNRATLHLHGGITPWISDGTPHQWITPASEQTGYPQGVSVQNVPDMNVCNAKDDGCQTFYYTNEQSARLMFYHDHAWGITRLNVYAGEAAGYLLTDATETKLLNGALAGLGYGTPLVIQDKTFVPSPAQMAQQDPTWDYARWGGEGNLWNHHVYMPAQNPGDPSGMSAFGRWMYGPWFWPPASPANGPIDNPYYDPNCDPNTAAFCEPQLIPGTPNISVGMEQFNDTPVVNGQAYPTTQVDPVPVRFRILNAANDRFWNLQWYVADSTGTEVALKASEVAAAQQDPNVFPTPDTNLSPEGPKFIQIGTEGGFLPAPVVVPNQPITWITDPTRFDVGNVDKHALLLAPAERADVIVDFSQFAGKTLILYNDAPAAFPARVASYDYYTGDPDLSPVGAPSTLPGYGPNTRTIMKVQVSNAGAVSFNMATLNAAFRHHADGSGVFESGSDPTIVGQAAYNSAYGTNFVAQGWCNAPGVTGTAANRCDGYARIAEGNHPTDLFGFNGLRSAYAPGTGKLQIPFQPKGLHDEMNSTSFDEYGRMQANLGLEAPNADPLLQNIILYPYVNPSTELIDGTNLPAGDVKVTPISSAADGTQIWKITHNGVDTHPIHWHLWNVQVINRVTWDNIIIPPDPNELGWKETVRVSPLEDTIVAVRPVIPQVPLELPNSIRNLSPMMPSDATTGFNNVDPQGNPTANIVNGLVNFGWEYVYHCHILSHEEMDMMRPVSVALPPIKPDGLTFTVNASNNLELTWNDNSITETSFLVQRTTGSGTGWIDVGDQRLAAGPAEHPRIPDVDRFCDLRPDRRVRVSSRGEEHGRLRGGVPEHDGPVGVRHHVHRASPGGSDQPDGRAGQSAGPSQLHRQRHRRDRLHGPARRQRRGLGDAHHAAGQPAGPPRAPSPTPTRPRPPATPTATGSGRTTVLQPRLGRTRPPWSWRPSRRLRPT